MLSSLRFVVVADNNIAVIRAADGDVLNVNAVGSRQPYDVCYFLN